MWAGWGIKSEGGEFFLAFEGGGGADGDFNGADLVGGGGIGLGDEFAGEAEGGLEVGKLAGGRVKDDESADKFDLVWGVYGQGVLVVAGVGEADLGSLVGLAAENVGFILREVGE